MQLERIGTKRSGDLARRLDNLLITRHGKRIVIYNV
jgi:hypothetical protein